MESPALIILHQLGKIRGIVIFSLFLFSLFNCCSQTIHVTNPITNSVISTNWDLQAGFNYYQNKFGESARLMYDVKYPVRIGISLDYLNGQFYQSSGNASLSYRINTKIGTVESYALTGTGFLFNNNYQVIGILGIGLEFQSPFDFKVYGIPIYIEVGGEIDKFSSLSSIVFKQYFGFRARF